MQPGKPTNFRVSICKDILIPCSGLAMIGQLLARCTRLYPRLNQTRAGTISHPDICNGDVVFAYLGLLCLGKTDYDHIETFRQDPFFLKALGIRHVPSSPTLRQRLSSAATGGEWFSILQEETVRLLKSTKTPVTATRWQRDGQRVDYVPVDIDVSPFDNSSTRKEGVSRTYKGVDGFAPIFAYVGEEGYALHGELRPGKDHCQNGTDRFLQTTLDLAKQVTSRRLLVRMDAGHDSQDNIAICHKAGVDFIIKRNLRHEAPGAWLAKAKQAGEPVREREGKTTWWGASTQTLKGEEAPARIVYRVTEQTMLADGQILMLPEIEVETWWTSLPDDPRIIDELYRQHGTSEQYHSEIKHDLDMERLPSGAFRLNDLVLRLTLLAYNLLRILGQQLVGEETGGLRRAATRRRIRTVIQNLIYQASRLVTHARRQYLQFSWFNPWVPVFARVLRFCSG